MKIEDRSLRVNEAVRFVRAENPYLALDLSDTVNFLDALAADKRIIVDAMQWAINESREASDLPSDEYSKQAAEWEVALNQFIHLSSDDG